MKKGILFIGTIALILGSCIKHEVIPAPVPTVDLNAHFIGTIGGATVELTENVLGYANSSEKAKIILPPPSFSSAVYYSEMSSAVTATSVKIGLGSINWDASLEIDPPLSSFNAFFLANDNPNYSNFGSNGFEVTYRDGFGSEWKSLETSVNFQDVSFSGISQDSDSTGDYSLFTCYFDCHVYNFDFSDSIKIQDAVYQGWFKR
jgi:hypothetical protein